MAGFDPSTDPRVRQAINWERAQRGMPPLDEPMAAQPTPAPHTVDAVGAVNTQQPLTPEEIAIGHAQAAQADQQAALDAFVRPQSHAAPASSPAVQPPISLDWQPPQQPEPRVMFGGAQEQTMPPAAPEMGGVPSTSPVRRGASGGGMLGGMVRAASAATKEADANRRKYEAVGDQAVAEQQVAREDLGNVRAGTFADVAKIRDEQAAAADAYRAEIDKINDTTSKALSAVEGEQRDISSWMAEHREPKDRRGWGQRIMGALAVAFGGLADQANLAATVNIGAPVQTNNKETALALIQRQIDRDIENQRAMLENARTELAGKQTEYGQLREKGYDDQQAASLKRSLDSDRAANQIEAIMSRGMSAEQRPLAEAAVADLRGQAAALRESVWSQRYDQAFARENQLKAAQAAQNAGPRAMTPMERAKYEEQLLKNEKARQELDGSSGLPTGLKLLGDQKPNERSLNMAQDLVSNAEGFRSVLGELRNMASEGATLSPTKRQTAGLLLGAAKSQYNLVLGDKTAANEAQLKMLDDLLVNPTAYSVADKEAVFKNLDDTVVSTTRGKLRGYGMDYDPAPEVRRGAAK